MTTKQEKELERICKALGNRRRLTILHILKKSKGASVGDLASELKLSIKSTSKHVATLTAAGLLEKEQRGPYMYCELSDEHPIFVKHLLSNL